MAALAAARAETVHAITVDGTAFHNAGAGDAEELGAAIAAGLEYLRALTAQSGLTIGAALSQLAFRYAATDDQFQTIAKFRAARLVWARIAQVCGASDFGGAPQHAVTSAAMMAQRDPWVNMLRTTLAAFGAGVGGADAVTVLPFDVALADGTLGVSKSFSSRIARNTQLLLLEESHLGRVLDPSAGSWYVEDLTQQIAATAWEFFQEIEAAGGYLAALEAGIVSGRIAATKAKRDSDIAHRKTTVTGVNEFPNLAKRRCPPKPSSPASPSPATQLHSKRFVTVRTRSSPPARPSHCASRAAGLGCRTQRSHHVCVQPARFGWYRRSQPRPARGGRRGHLRCSQGSGATVAVLCGTDKRYGESAAAAVAELRAAGIAKVLLAGPEKAVADATGDSRPDGFLTARIDAVSALTELLDFIETGSSK